MSTDYSLQPPTKKRKMDEADVADVTGNLISLVMWVEFESPVFVFLQKPELFILIVWIVIG